MQDSRDLTAWISPRGSIGFCVASLRLGSYDEREFVITRVECVLLKTKKNKYKNVLRMWSRTLKEFCQP